MVEYTCRWWEFSGLSGKPSELLEEWLTEVARDGWKLVGPPIPWRYIDRKYDNGDIYQTVHTVMAVFEREKRGT